jgi:hypothetical protein
MRIPLFIHIRILALILASLFLGACVSDNSASTSNPSNVVISNTDPSTGGDTANYTGTASLSWLPPTENTDGSTLTDLVGYKIYYGTSPDNLTNVISNISIGITNYVIDNLKTNTTYYFSMTAVNLNNVESDLSNIVSKNIAV